MSEPRRLPAPWPVIELAEAYVVQDATGQPLAYVYFEEDLSRIHVTQRLTKDEARRVAANIARLPDLLRGDREPS